MSAAANAHLSVFLALVATVVCAAVVLFYQQARRLSVRRARAEDEVASDEARLLQQEISFYEQRQADLARNAERRHRLSAAARGLGALLDPAQIQDKLIEIARLLFPAHSVGISHGHNLDAIDNQVLQRRQPLLVPGELMKGAPLMAVPISARQSVVGVLRVENPAAGSTAPYSREDLRLLEILANLASLAMDNCLLFNQVQQTALRDHLTGLLTHRAFQEQLEESVLSASRFNQPLSIILVDVDHFKSINDTHGHQAGDHILQGLAHVLDRNARPVDILARYGGEEFALLMLQTSHPEAVAMAEQIRRDLAEQIFEAAGKGLSITASFGVATFPDDATSGQQLFRQADQRLYKAKAGGRNQVQGRSS